MRNKPFVLLIAFTGLMATVFQLSRSLHTAAADIRAQPIDWVTISLANPPRPLPDPSLVTVVAQAADLAFVSSPIPENIYGDH